MCAKLSKKALGAMGTKITTIAKKIRSGKPSMKWTDAMKAAGKQMKGKPITTTKKKATKKRKTKSKK
jgi:hypothetical protein